MYLIPLSLLSTAYIMNGETNSDAEFAYGAGHINPRAATDPGLIYDAREVEYVKFLFGQGYRTKQLRLVTGDNNSCSKDRQSTVWDLNYPSFTLSAQSGQSVTRVFHRTVTNVGKAKSTYHAIVEAPNWLKIQVRPEVLSFKSLGEKKSFVVTVTAKMGYSLLSGSLTWEDSEYLHHVRSPIVAHFFS
ncbi:conserved hypothetical protein [Ricinus communis]|uniref:Subtilisin-like protease fibronectin type-III domain-containing protein n=1 Tax=Ricinus communis TaxID=3988 RepID=B9SE34_RICCO|nr:conserved hypothetical protein [Ricinus communis]